MLSYNLGHELLQVGFKSGAVKVDTGHASRKHMRTMTRSSRTGVTATLSESDTLRSLAKAFTPYSP